MAVTQALIAAPTDTISLGNGTRTGGYDLMELRRKLEQRMEYSKVNSLPTDPAMKPDESITSYANHSESMERDNAMKKMQELSALEY